MAYQNTLFILILAVLNINLINCAEFVPVYMWSSKNKLSEHVPALHKISQDSFKDTLLEYLKGDPYIIVFTEYNLSPEDLAQRDENGEITFKNIHRLKDENLHVAYRPYVQNPIEAIKQLNKPVSEISIETLLKSSTLPDNILVIDLNDAKDEETRTHMLKRHDSDVVSIYEAVQEKHGNVLAIYTAHHSSWVAPEDVTHNKMRNLLAEGDAQTDNSMHWTGDQFLLYLTDKGTYTIDNTTINITSDFVPSVDKKGDNVTATLTNGATKIEFLLRNSTGYWYIDSVGVDGKSTKLADVYAPIGFSYHCTNLRLTIDKGLLYLPGFQLQAFYNNTHFRDAYDCVGFTSVPIWSGLFVTAILLFIVTIGLTMMMDIKTMDRFDDPKGKTITVNASE